MELPLIMLVAEEAPQHTTQAVLGELVVVAMEAQTQ